MLGCYQVCQRGYQQGKQRHCSIAVMEILSACAKLMNTTGYLLSRFARNLILYTVWNLEEKNSITPNTAFWVVSKMLINAVVCQINQYNVFTWPARFCEDEKICEILITHYIFLFSPELLILGLFTSNWANRQFLLHKLGLGMCHLLNELQLSQTGHKI